VTRDESTRGGSSDVDVPADSSSRLAAAPCCEAQWSNDHARSVTHDDEGGAPPRRGFITSFDSGAKGVIASGMIGIALQLLHSNGRNQKKLFARRH
jgi:hypothetical protein